MLLGSNRDEATLFSLLRLMPTEPAAVEAYVRERLPPERATGVLAAYPADRAGRLRLAGDAVFGIPMMHFAERQRAPTWMYRLDWATPAFGGVLGAMHALEIFLMWMNLERRGVQLVLGGPPSAELRALADRMKRYWLAFVRDGDPGSSWPRYQLPARTTRLFDLEDRLVDDPDTAYRCAWDGLDSIDR
jgi:para-nitrobenzyl esterase